jgi:hypothetical protein
MAFAVADVLGETRVDYGRHAQIALSLDAASRCRKFRRNGVKAPLLTF